MDALTKVNKIVIHHSGKDHHSIETIRHIHVNLNGWEEIGYHFVIGNGIDSIDGELYNTRSTEFLGAHVKGYNLDSIGICLIGNLDEHKPTKEQIKTLTNLIQKLIIQYNLKITDVLGHREFPLVTKTCPGKKFDMDELRELIKLELLSH